MKCISRLMLTAVCASGILSSTFAADDVRKNMPARRDVEETLEAIGGDHNPEKMKVSPLGSVETDSTYYHVFYGTLKNGSYHLIFFDNTPEYLGYYLISLEPTGYGEGELYLYLTSNSSVTIPIGDEGPQPRINIGDTGMKAPFITAPVKIEPVEEETVDSQIGAPSKPTKKPEYRSWTVTKSGRALKIESAIFVEIDDGNVTIKNGKNGLTATVPVSALSTEDKDYLKDLLQ